MDELPLRTAEELRLVADELPLRTADDDAEAVRLRTAEEEIAEDAALEVLRPSMRPVAVLVEPDDARTLPVRRAGETILLPAALRPALCAMAVA